MPRDLGKLEDDMGSIQSKTVSKPAPSPKPRPDPRDADIFTADKGIQPPSPDEGPTKTVKKAKGGMCCSASKRADGAAIRGKTRGRIV